ncbi:MAG: hydroxypyruvate isomerase family protein [Candidatus Cyclobacteriaceae bacterium M3_2C_046]
MKRRIFVKNSLAAGAVALSSASLSLADQAKSPQAKHNFKLHYAPHFGMFKNAAGDDPIDQLKFAADQGFTAWEDNGMKNKPVDLQEKIAQTMSDLGMKMGVFVAHSISWREPSLTSGDKDKLDLFLKEIRESVDVAKRVNAKWMTVVPGHVDLRQEMDYQTANVVDALRRASEILEPHGLVMVLEPLNWWANHPGLFLSKIPQGYLICKAVNSPSCKILFDIYHQQITEGNLIPNMDKAWDEVAYFQVGDNPGRKEPTTGEINYKNVFQHIHQKGFEGVVGMEHGNSKPGEEGEMAVIQAYASVDDFGPKS